MKPYRIKGATRIIHMSKSRSALVKVNEPGEIPHINHFSVFTDGDSRDGGNRRHKESVCPDTQVSGRDPYGHQLCDQLQNGLSWNAWDQYIELAEPE